MSELLENGFWVKTVLGETATVEKFLADEKQYNSYSVDYKKQEKILIWFKKDYWEADLETLYDSLKQDMDRKSSDSKALRPLDITEYKDGSFGYITDHRPEEYDDLIKEMLHYFETLVLNRDDNYDR